MATPATQPARIDASMRIVILHGPESYIIQERTRQLEAALSEAYGGRIDQFSLDGAEVELSDVLDEVRSYGLLGSHKLVIVDNADAFLAGRRRGKGHGDGDGANGPDDGNTDRGTARRRALERYAQAPVDHATLLLRAGTWRPGKLDKLVAQVGAVVKCELKNQSQAANWCLDHCPGQHSCRIEAEAARMLVERAGVDLARLDTELAKLASFAGDRPDNTIMPADVAQLVSMSRQEQAWVLQSAIVTGRREAALGRLRELMAISRQPEALLMWAIGDLLRRLHSAAHLLRQGRSPSEVTGKLRLYGDAGRTMIDVARRLDPARIAQLLQVTLETDRRNKSGFGQPDRGLETLTVLVTDTIAGT